MTFATVSPPRKRLPRSKTSPFGWIAGSGFCALRPSSRVIRPSRLSCASAAAAAEPGSCTAVGVNWRPTVRTVSLKRSKLKYSPIDSDCGMVTSIPSSGSQSLSAETGSAASVAVTESRRSRPRPRSTLPSCVLPKDSLTVPRTRTTSPAATGSAAEHEQALGRLRVRVDVAVLLLHEEAVNPPGPWKSPTTTPSMTRWLPATGLRPRCPGSRGSRSPGHRRRRRTASAGAGSRSQCRE